MYQGFHKVAHIRPYYSGVLFVPTSCLLRVLRLPHAHMPYNTAAMLGTEMKHNETGYENGSPSALSARDSLTLALPIMAGYAVLGVPCGILCATAGMTWWMAALMSILLYSGAGQYMIPNMYLAGNPLTAIILSVSLVNLRQMLYGASLSQFCGGVSKRLAFLFSATVTDETFGVNLARFINGGWTLRAALAVNLFSQSAWILANIVGVLLGSALSFPTALASFAMTSLFICLLCMQKASRSNAVAAGGAALGVVACKCAGLSGPAIFIGALVGLCCALVFSLKAGEGQDSAIKVGD